MTDMTATSRSRPRRCPAGSSGRSGSSIAPPTGSRGDGSGSARPTPTRWGMLRLHTVGRKSGQERVAILGFIEDGPNLVTPAMNGWADPEPAWWLNLQAQPEAFVESPDGPAQGRRPRGDRRRARAPVAGVRRPRFLRVQRCQRRPAVARDGDRRPGAARLATRSTSCETASRGPIRRRSSGRAPGTGRPIRGRSSMRGRDPRTRSAPSGHSCP